MADGKLPGAVPNTTTNTQQQFHFSVSIEVLPIIHKKYTLWLKISLPEISKQIKLQTVVKRTHKLQINVEQRLLLLSSFCWYWVKLIKRAIVTTILSSFMSHGYGRCLWYSH